MTGQQHRVDHDDYTLSTAPSEFGQLDLFAGMAAVRDDTNEIVAVADMEGHRRPRDPRESCCALFVRFAHHRAR